MKQRVIGAMLMAMIEGVSCAMGAGDAGRTPVPAADLPLATKAEDRAAVFAGGCFWCTEAVFEQVPGVKDVVSGYAGDSKETASYEVVCSGRTNHAEAVQITYDASRLSYGRLLQVFFSSHDPTTLNRQGPDAGRQYRSAVFYGNEDEKRIAQAYIHQLDAGKYFSRPIVTSLEPMAGFYPAEKHHQDYARLNPFQPYIERYAAPKAQKAKKLFGEAPATSPATRPE